jgi:nuclear transport factor 2 (NTF2) superfamily protein
MPRPPLPPFTLDTAIQKVRLAEDAWNGRDPARVALAYSPHSRWRNRSTFLQGRAEIEAFLAQKWQRELDYRLIKELWAHDGNRIAGQAPRTAARRGHRDRDRQRACSCKGTADPASQTGIHH